MNLGKFKKGVWTVDSGHANHHFLKDSSVQIERDRMESKDCSSTRLELRILPDP